MDDRCQTCGRKQLILIQALVPSNQRMNLGHVLNIDYCLGPGSGVELPMHLCLTCGTIQGDWPLIELL
jgi:hypothetical protein